MAARICFEIYLFVFERAPNPLGAEGRMSSRCRGARRRAPDRRQQRGRQRGASLVLPAQVRELAVRKRATIRVAARVAPTWVRSILRCTAPHHGQRDGAAEPIPGL